MRGKSSLVLMLMLFSSASHADDAYPINQVADGVYYHQGVHEDANETNMGAIANVGLLLVNVVSRL
ncbi:hypothetical protein [Methylophaga frappieri]|nr:hypothetical protein [Methylophaga frappieri]